MLTSPVTSPRALRWSEPQLDILINDLGTLRMNRVWMKKVGEAYIADSVLLTGEVHLGVGVNLWPQVIIRGDIGVLRLGKRVNLQDGTIVHTDFGITMEIEDEVVVGHRATLHGRKIGRGSLIGMGATLLNGSVIGEESLVAAGSIVTEGKEFPARSVLRGAPARLVREVTEEELQHIRRINQSYFELAQKYSTGEMPWIGNQ